METLNIVDNKEEPGLWDQLTFDGESDCPEFKPNRLRPDLCTNCSKKLAKHTRDAVKEVAYVKAALEYSDVSPSLIFAHPTSKARLFLGSMNAVTTKSPIRKNGIRAVINTAKGLNMFGPKYFDSRSELENEGVIFLDLNWVDGLDQKIDDADLEPPLKFLHEHLVEHGTSVLVHCAQGKSRSATIVVAYIMLLDNVPYEEALAFVRKGRMMAQPNPNFAARLKSWFKRSSFTSLQNDFGISST